MSTVAPHPGRSTIADLARLVVRHRELTWAMARREITDRYAGQVLGAYWAVGHPLVLLSVYVFVFAYVLQLKIGGDRSMPLDYTTYLLAGLLPWLASQEAMLKGSAVLAANANLVKQVVFPIEVLPLKGIVAAMVTQTIGTLLLMAYCGWQSASLTWTWALVPVLMGFQFLALTGVCFVLSSVGAYLRDVKDIVQAFATIGMYLLPICYLPAWVPEPLRPLLYANPFSYLVWCYQDAIYFGRIEHPIAWIVFPLGALIVAAVGFRVFRRLKLCLGSVL